jgi:hypothetical protein
MADWIEDESFWEALEPFLFPKERMGAAEGEVDQILDDWSRIRNEWIVIRDGRSTSFEFHHTVYSGQELKDPYLQTGFGDVRVYGDLDGSVYGPGAERLVAVGRK